MHFVDNHVFEGLHKAAAQLGLTLAAQVAVACKDLSELLMRQTVNAPEGQVLQYFEELLVYVLMSQEYHGGIHLGKLFVAYLRDLTLEILCELGSQLLVVQEGSGSKKVD